MMNILDNQILHYHKISTIKNCREIKFSNGG
jgi:WD40 repeat protein